MLKPRKKVREVIFMNSMKVMEICIISPSAGYKSRKIHPSNNLQHIYSPE